MTAASAAAAAAGSCIMHDCCLLPLPLGRGEEAWLPRPSPQLCTAATEGCLLPWPADGAGLLPPGAASPLSWLPPSTIESTIAGGEFHSHK